MSIAKNRLSIARIGPGDEATVLLLIEGGAFTKNDITNCLSKKTKGTIVTQLKEIPPTGLQRIGLVAACVVIPGVFYLMFIGIDYLASTNVGRAVLLADTEKPSAKEKEESELNGWLVPNLYAKASNRLYKALTDQDLVISIKQILRKADIATVAIFVENKTRTPIRYTVSMATSASEGRIPSYDRRLSDLLVMPGRSLERTIKVVIPEKSSDPSDKVIFVRMFVEDFQGETLSLSRMHRVD